ncbi:MAG: glycosyltransferase 87 family protein [Elusimicrobia bacterium]|nr:glycosyltransferase 87 family protein [Elusimicrobiota bacterium]
MNLKVFNKNFTTKSIFVCAGILILMVILGLVYGTKSRDFKTFYDIGVFARLKMNIYAASPTTGFFVFYMPFFSILMIPWTFFPERYSSFVFFNLNFIILIILFIVLLGDFKKNIDSIEKKTIAILIILLMLFDFIWLGIRIGQVDLIVCCLIILGIRLFYEEKFGISAFCLALSGFKVVPLIFLFFVLFSKKIKYMLFYLGFVIFFALLPFVYFGIDEGFLQYKNLYTISISQKLEINNFDLNWHNRNQSLWKLFGNFLRSLNINNNEILIIIMIILMLIILIYTYNLINKINDNERETIYLKGSVFIMLMLLFSPDTCRVHHLTNLLLPYFIIVSMSYKGKVEIVLVFFIIVANILTGKYAIFRSFYGYSYTIIMITVLIYFYYKLNLIKRNNLLRMK